MSKDKPVKKRTAPSVKAKAKVKAKVKDTPFKLTQLASSSTPTNGFVEWSAKRASLHTRVTLTEIGKEIGFGAVMQQAAGDWRKAAQGSEYAIGPAVKATVPCVCRDAEGTTCQYCRGCGWLTRSVIDGLRTHALSKLTNEDKHALGLPVLCTRCLSQGATLGPDPYEADLNGDNTEVWLCEPCRDERADAL